MKTAPILISFTPRYFFLTVIKAVRLGVNAEITQNWDAKTTLISLNPSIGAVTKLGDQVVQFAISPLIPITGPSESKPDWGLRAILAFVFPGS